MDPEKIKSTAEGYKSQMSKFLRDLIKIPGESRTEEKVIYRVAEEMSKVGFDRIEIDEMGNILGYMGTGETLIAYDAHVDTVGAGELCNWEFDPYEGFETETEIGGRGSSDQLGGIVSAIYGAKIMKDLNLIGKSYTILVAGTVQVEECEGLSWQYLINKSGIKPEFVVITEPTDGKIHRGQRGHMEIKVEVKGMSCFCSVPERGDNAIYKMAEIINELRELNERLHEDMFLGKGTLAVSQIFYSSPSRGTVADMCAVSVDRRLTGGETCQMALEQIENLTSVRKYSAKVTMYKYDSPSYKGLVYPADCYFPSWVLPEDHKLTKAMVMAYEGMYGEAMVDKWTFSTNGVSIMGRFSIPCIGFGPGKESRAHTPNEKMWKDDLVRCAAVYAALPTIYFQRL